MHCVDSQRETETQHQNINTSWYSPLSCATGILCRAERAAALTALKLCAAGSLSVITRFRAAPLCKLTPAKGRGQGAALISRAWRTWMRQRQARQNTHSFLSQCRAALLIKPYPTWWIMQQPPCNPPVSFLLLTTLCSTISPSHMHTLNRGMAGKKGSALSAAQHKKYIKMFRSFADGGESGGT